VVWGILSELRGAKMQMVMRCDLYGK
jgi:hypothetical protein